MKVEGGVEGKVEDHSEKAETEMRLETVDWVLEPCLAEPADQIRGRRWCGACSFCVTERWGGGKGWIWGSTALKGK